MTANGLVFSAPRPEETEFSRRVWKSAPRVRSCSRWALIVSDTLAVVFIDAHPRARSPYGRLWEAAPPRLEATQGSEAQVAPKGPRPPNGLGVVLRPRRAARLYGVARAACLFGDLHRPAPPVLA